MRGPLSRAAVAGILRPRDALRDRPHTTHFNITQALEVVDRLAPERTFFTHISHDLPHAATNARLPAGVELAYDGLVLEIPS